MNRKEWYQLDDVERLSDKVKISLTKQYFNPGQAKMFKILGFDKVWASSAEGMYIHLSDNRDILDITGGNCVLGLGHNHPRILAARAKVSAQKRLEVCKSFLSPYTAVLASNVAHLLPGDLQYSFFCNSGAEAIEGALKLAQKHHGVDRLGLVHTDHSFHGKTHAAMSISSLEESRHHFQLLKKCYQVPYGDAEALEKLLLSRCKNQNSKPDICAFIVEAIHGTRIIFPPVGYLKKVRNLCDKYDILLIVDEIYVGFGRTGYWFAFEAEDIVPDIVCYSKVFGGGKATIAGYTARKDVFLKAYGKMDNSMMHSSTFSGMSEECATAIEALNIIKEDGLVDRASKMGQYLGPKLNLLKDKYPDRILDVRGRGLMWGVELKPFISMSNPAIDKFLSKGESQILALTGAIVLAELFHSYNILSYLGFTRRNLIVISPPLIVDKKELDLVVNALDKILATSWLELSRRFISRLMISNK